LQSVAGGIDEQESALRRSESSLDWSAAGREYSIFSNQGLAIQLLKTGTSLTDNIKEDARIDD